MITVSNINCIETYFIKSPRIRNEITAQNFAWFRKMALSLLAKDEATISNRRKMLRNGRNPENILKELVA